jgi:hypothetical protein
MIEGLPWAMLVVATIATVLIRNSEREAWAADLGLCALTALWMTAERVLAPAWRDRGWVMGVYFTGLVILMSVLVYWDPWFGFFTFTGYFPAMRLRAWWARALGVAAIATLTGTSQAGGVPKQGGIMIFIWLACVLINLIVAGDSPGSAGCRTSRTRSASPWLRSFARRTRGWRPPSRRTPGCTSSYWFRHERRGSWTSGSAWHGKSTTPWPGA